MQYETVIGLEVHAQLKTNTKIFCGCSVQFGADPNTQTCPVCLGMPGVLPVTNKKVVEYAVRMGLAVNCKIREHSIFARKNYFYPDLPKGYQISQYEEPICEHGWIEIPDENNDIRKIGICRIHLEEDAGKSIHEETFVKKGESLVDLNRCGTPLIEIVSDPEMHSPKEAYEYLHKIRQLVRWLDICDGNMEEGSLRCDANISLRPVGSKTLGTKTELKNMNSIRGVEKALTYEIKRQTAILSNGGNIVQETLLWDESAGKAQSMRSKEEAHDYRYFPDPDLVPLIVEDAWKVQIQNELPELPEARKQRWIESWQLPEYDVSVLNEDRNISDFFQDVADQVENPKQAANWMMGEVSRILNQEKKDIVDLKLSTKDLVEIISLVNNNTISENAGKKVLAELAFQGGTPADMIDKLGLKQISGEDALESVVLEILEESKTEVERYLQGNDRLFGFFVGQAMKKTKGQANPKVINELLKTKLDELKSES